MAVTLGYPFATSIWLSLTDIWIGNINSARFVGLENYTRLLNDTIFLQAVRNSFVFTTGAVALKILIGVPLAVLLMRLRKGTAVFRSLTLLPWVAPVALSVLAWQWIFDPSLGVLNTILRALGITDFGYSWLGSPNLAMASVVIVNAWRGFPFYAVNVMAGLSAIPSEVYEAAAIDGATSWQIFWRITLPLLKPVLTVVILYSVISTFSDFAVVHILTRGGPMNLTHVFSTLAFQRGILGGRVGEAAAISLSVVPFLAVVAIVFLRNVSSERESR